MPKAEVTLRDTLPGAIIGGLLWETAKYVFAWSLNYFHYDQILRICWSSGGSVDLELCL